MKKQIGFTLIEIMLVMVLISVSAVAVIVTLPDNVQDVSKEQAMRLYQRLQLLNEEAVLNGKDFGIYVNEEKRRYDFQVLEAEGWKAMEKNRFYAETELEDGLALALHLGGGAWADDDRLFEPGSLFDEDMFAEEEEKRPPPQIFVLSSGEITPFLIAFYPNTGDEEQDGWRIKVEESGLITLLAPGESDEEA